MKITVFGATGKVGKLLVAQLLEEGHSVTAFVHRNNSLPLHENLSIVHGDIHNPDDITEAIQDCEIVVSCLGSWGTKSKDIVSTAIENLIPAMQAAGIERIISLTGAGALDTGQKVNFINSLFHSGMKLTAGKVLRDGERQLELLHATNLNWTVVRSPIMRSGGNRQNFILTSKLPAAWETIDRIAVVQAISELITSGDCTKMAPYIRRKS